MSWVDDTVAEFGRSMGLGPLSFDSSGVVSLQFERLGSLFIERLEGQGQVLVYLAREFAAHDPAVPRRALALCHYREQPPYPLQSAIHKDQQIVFGLRIPDREFQLPTLERALSYLDYVHQRAATG